MTQKKKKTTNTWPTPGRSNTRLENAARELSARVEALDVLPLNLQEVSPLQDENPEQ